MIRRPPRSTRTDTLFPYTTLFRSIATTVIAGAALAILLWPHTPPSSAQGEAPPTPRPVVRATSEPARAPAHAEVPATIPAAIEDHDDVVSLDDVTGDADQIGRAHV